MSGFVGDLSPKQEDKLIKIKEILKDVLTPEHDDHLLLRFLRARNFDVNKTETMFKKDLEWRARLGVKEIAANFKLPEVCDKYWPGGHAGFDKDGEPVWIEPTGMLDVKGLLQSCKSGDIIKYHICNLERFMKTINEQTQKLGKPIAGFTYIMDMHGLGRQHLWKPGVDLYNQITSILQDHYPECLKKILIVRAPKIFPLVYALCRPYLSSETRKKIHILGGDWKAALLDFVDEDVLPVYWGGKATDADGNTMCSSKICLGGEVPKSYYSQDVDIADDNMTERDIKRGSMLEFKYRVTKPGSFFRYAFKTKDHDIAFGIKRIESNGQKVKILETTRVNSHFVLQDGQVELETAGYYVFKFDNRFSWTKPKKIMYMLELLEPVGDLDEEQVSSKALNDNSQTTDNKQDEESNNKNNEINKDVENSVKEDRNTEKECNVMENDKEVTQEKVTELKEVVSSNDGSDVKEVENVVNKDTNAGQPEGIKDNLNEAQSEKKDGDTGGDTKGESTKEEIKDEMAVSVQEQDEYVVVNSTSESSTKEENIEKSIENKEESEKEERNDVTEIEEQVITV